MRRTLRIAAAGAAAVLAVSLFAVWSFESQYRDEARAYARPYGAPYGGDSPPVSIPVGRTVPDHGSPDPNSHEEIAKLAAQIEHAYTAPNKPGALKIFKPLPGGIGVRYRVVNVCPVQDPDNTALNLNNTGTVSISIDDTSAYLWKSGRRRKLPPVHSFPYQKVAAVDDHGNAVGAAWDEHSGAFTEYDSDAVEWTRGKAFGLGTPAALSNCSAVDINSHGQVLCFA